MLPAAAAAAGTQLMNKSQNDPILQMPFASNNNSRFKKFKLVVVSLATCSIASRRVVVELELDELGAPSSNVDSTAYQFCGEGSDFWLPRDSHFTKRPKRRQASPGKLRAQSAMQSSERAQEVQRTL